MKETTRPKLRPETVYAVSLKFRSGSVIPLSCYRTDPAGLKEEIGSGVYSKVDQTCGQSIVIGVSMTVGVWAEWVETTPTEGA